MKNLALLLNEAEENAAHKQAVGMGARTLDTPGTELCLGMGQVAATSSSTAPQAPQELQSQIGPSLDALGMPCKGPKGA